MKEKIRHHAVRLFDKNGFHGTSMRDIGDAAGCKTPTVYHYYASKEKLFDEVVRVAYLNLLDELRKELPNTLSAKDYCILTLVQKKNLSEDDLIVHRLAMKTWLGFEGCEETRIKLLEWEDSRIARNKALLAKIIQTEAWINIINRTYTNIAERIILFSDNIPDNQIAEEMNLVFGAALSK